MGSKYDAFTISAVRSNIIASHTCARRSVVELRGQVLMSEMSAKLAPKLLPAAFSLACSAGHRGSAATAVHTPTPTP